MILSFRTDMPGQTAQTQIRLLCIVWTHYSMVEPLSSNFRVITTNVLGVRIFRKFTIVSVAEQANFSLIVAQLQKTGFLMTWLTCNRSYLRQKSEKNRSRTATPYTFLVFWAKGNVIITLYMSHDTTKCVFRSFRPGQTQTGLRSHKS